VRNQRYKLSVNIVKMTGDNSLVPVARVDNRDIKLYQIFHVLNFLSANFRR